MSTPAVAHCTWFWRLRALDPWVSYETGDCRASVADKIVTVWLPGGAVIRLGRTPWRKDDTFARTFMHWYDNGYRRIEIKLSPVADAPKKCEKNANPGT